MNCLKFLLALLASQVGLIGASSLSSMAPVDSSISNSGVKRAIDKQMSCCCPQNHCHAAANTFPLWFDNQYWFAVPDSRGPLNISYGSTGLYDHPSPSKISKQLTVGGYQISAVVRQLGRNGLSGEVLGWQCLSVEGHCILAIAWQEYLSGEVLGSQCLSVEGHPTFGFEVLGSQQRLSNFGCRPTPGSLRFPLPVSREPLNFGHGLEGPYIRLPIGRCEDEVLGCKSWARLSNFGCRPTVGLQGLVGPRKWDQPLGCRSWARLSNFGRRPTAGSGSQYLLVE